MASFVCAACGGNLTVASEVYDDKSILRPLVSVEVEPCKECMAIEIDLATMGTVSDGKDND